MRRYFVLFTVLLLTAIMGVCKNIVGNQINKSFSSIVEQSQYLTANQNRDTNQLKNQEKRIIELKKMENQENDLKKKGNFIELKKIGE